MSKQDDIKEGRKQAREELRYKIYQRIVYLKEDEAGKKEDPKGINGAIFVLEELLKREFPNLSGKMHDALHAKVEGGENESH